MQLQIDPDDTGVFTNAFHGVMIELPQARETRKGTFTAVGTRDLFKLRSVDTRRLTTRQDVSSFVNDLSDLFPSQVAYATPSPTGFELSEFHAPGIRLSEALDLLAQSVTGYQWGVDASGTLLFEQPSGSTSVAYATSGLRRLPINGQEVATGINLIALNGQSNRPLRQGDTYGVRDLGSGSGYETRKSSPVIHSYEDALHSTYGAERTYLVNNPMGFLTVDYTRNPYTLLASGMSSGSNAFDEDPTTFAQWDGSSASCEIGPVTSDGGTSNPYETPVAVRVIFECSGVNVALDILRRRWTGSVNRDERFFETVATANGYYDILLILPPDDTVRGGAREDDYTLRVDTISGTDVFKVFSVEPLFLDAGALDRLAQSLVRLPASEPLELDLEGYTVPAASVTVTGAPGGDVTGDAAEFRYGLSHELGLRTVVDLEQRVEGMNSRLIRLSAQQVTQVSQDTLRSYLTRE